MYSISTTHDSLCYCFSMFELSPSVEINLIAGSLVSVVSHCVFLGLKVFIMGFYLLSLNFQMIYLSSYYVLCYGGFLELFSDLLGCM